MKSIQLELPWETTSQDVQDYIKHTGVQTWWYITSADNQRMVYGEYPDGTLSWIPHDCRTTVPMLFNTRKGAKATAQRLKKPYRVKKWPYEIGHR